MPTLTNLNVVQILQVGISGLCFLLAFLVYSLLRRALTLPSVGEHIIKLIKSFMLLTCVFVVLVFATTILNTFISKQRIEQLAEEKSNLSNVAKLQESEIAALRAKSMELEQTIDDLRGTSSAPIQAPAFQINDAWVKLYEHDNFRGREVVVKYPHNIVNFGSIDFHDKASSAKWKIPKGWRVYLYKHDSYSGEFVALEGTDNEKSFADLKRQLGRGDEASSLKWIKGN